MRVLFFNATELVGHLLQRLLNSTGRPCLVDKLIEVCDYFSVELLDVFLEQLLIPSLGIRIVLIEV